MASHWEIVANASRPASDTPQALWDNACAYFLFMDENPKKIVKTLTSGKAAGQTITTYKILPYSIKALCLHCGLEEEYLRDIRNSGNTSDSYYIVVSKILYIIYVQNYEMAAIGEHNAVFASKVLNLDRDDTKPKSPTVIIREGLPTLSTSENEVLEKLEIENRDLGKAG